MLVDQSYLTINNSFYLYRDILAEVQLWWTLLVNGFQTRASGLFLVPPIVDHYFQNLWQLLGGGNNPVQAPENRKFLLHMQSETYLVNHLEIWRQIVSDFYIVFPNVTLFQFRVPDSSHRFWRLGIKNIAVVKSLSWNVLCVDV